MIRSRFLVAVGEDPTGYMVYFAEKDECRASIVTRTTRVFVGVLTRNRGLCAVGLASDIR